LDSYQYFSTKKGENYIFGMVFRGPKSKIVRYPNEIKSMEKRLVDSFWDFTSNGFGECHALFDLQNGKGVHMVLSRSTIKSYFDRFGDFKKINKILVSEPVFMEIMIKKLKDESSQEKVKIKDSVHIPISPEDFDFKDYREQA